MDSPRQLNTVATYTCTNGYTLSGDTIRTCGSDGGWSGSAPTCQGESLLILITSNQFFVLLWPQLSALTYLLTMVMFYTMVDQLTIDQWEVWLLISVLLATVFLLVTTPGPVEMMDSGVGQLQCVKVQSI